MMFTATICAFLTTGMVKDELSKYLLSDIATGIHNLDHYVQDAVNDTESFVMTNMYKMQVNTVKKWSLLKCGMYNYDY